MRFFDDGLMCPPSRADSYVRARAVELALPELKRWWRSDFDEDDVELTAQLMKVINLSDGYSIVKALEREGWCGDDSLVEIFSESFIEQALAELTEQWRRCVDGAICGVPGTARAADAVL